MDTVKLSFEQKKVIDRIGKEYGDEISTLSFVILYIWRNYMGKEIVLWDNLYSLKYLPYGDNSWTFPVGDEESCIKFIESHILEPNFSLCFMNQNDKDFLERHFAGHFELVETPSDSEYIYKVDEHISLSGKKFHNLRNEINSIEKNHRIRVEILNDDSFPILKSIISDWAIEHTSDGLLGTVGDEADYDALVMYKELGISGIIIYMDDEPVSVAAGFELSDNTFDMFLCKKRIPNRSLSYYTIRECIKTLEGKYEYVNLEDDMGIEGLRLLKQRLRPVRMNNMWKATRI